MNDIQKRLLDLADRSYRTNTYTFTDFLSLAELSDYYMIKNQLDFASCKVFGGYDQCDRAIIRFGNPDALMYDIDFPIVCIHIRPLVKKFADQLSHRDFLGALMNLGIERHTLGDIRIRDNEAYLLCLLSIAPYITKNLTKIKHTSVSCKEVDITSLPLDTFVDEPDTRHIVVSSLRADGIISKVHNLSRNDSLTLFKSQKVFINGRLCENNSVNVKAGDIINARGFGKFQISSDAKETKKGRISLCVLIW